jgi:OOP family OmpA-OmpF porin
MQRDPNTSRRGCARPICMLSLTALLAACAPQTRVVLLPQASGEPSAVEVRVGDKVQSLTRPYQVLTVGPRGGMEVDTLSAEQVRQAYPRLLSLQPWAAENFRLEFLPGSSELTSASREQLSTVVARAQARAGSEIVVTGHTDRVGSLEANDRLSLQRAQAVRQLLIERGFEPERIEAVGRGEREPLVDTPDEVAEPRNRRAEVTVR